MRDCASEDAPLGAELQSAVRVVGLNAERTIRAMAHPGTKTAIFTPKSIPDPAARIH
jgi:hypothetical protein